MGKLFLWKGVWWKKKGLEKKVAFVGKFLKNPLSILLTCVFFKINWAVPDLIVRVHAEP